MSARNPGDACIGIRARTARAVAVVVSGTAQAPEVVGREDLVLALAGEPALFQPYHLVMDLPWDRAVATVGESERTLEALASGRLATFAAALRSMGYLASGVALVGAPDRRPGSVGSPHIRAHAAEGVLFRHVWQVAARSLGLPITAFGEKELAASAEALLGLPGGVIRQRLAGMGRAAGRPWRSDEKAAALSAWIAIVAAPPAANTTGRAS